MTIGSKRASTTGTIGDGPHGSNGDGSGDFDFYKLSAAKDGQNFAVDIDTVAPDTLDSVVVVWDAAGNVLGAQRRRGSEPRSKLLFTIPRNGDYYVSVAGFPAAVPNDPFASGSGPGAGSEGPYTVIFGLDADDTDVYSVDLRAGDVLGASVTGAATDIAVLGPLGVKRVGSDRTRAASTRGRPAFPEAATGAGPCAAATGRHFIAVTAALVTTTSRSRCTGRARSRSAPGRADDLPRLQRAPREHAIFGGRGCVSCTRCGRSRPLGTHAGTGEQRHQPDRDHRRGELGERLRYRWSRGQDPQQP